MIYWFIRGHYDDILGNDWSPMRYTGSKAFTETITGSEVVTKIIFWVSSGDSDDILGQNWSSLRYTGSVAFTETIYWFIIGKCDDKPGQ